MPHLDEGTIHAWLEGGLAPDEAALTEEHIAACDECSAAVAEARGLIAASSRILTALDNVPSGVIPARAQRVRRWYMRRELQAAAAVLLVAGSTLVFMRGEQKGMVSRSAVVSSPIDTQASAAAGPVVSETAPPPSTTGEGTIQERPQVAAVAPKAAASVEPSRRLLQKAAEPVETREEAKTLIASDAAAQSAPVQRTAPPAAPALGNIAEFERSARADSAARPQFLDVFDKPRLLKVERHIGYEPWRIYEVARGVRLTVMRPSKTELQSVVVTGANTEVDKRSVNAAARQKAAREPALTMAPQDSIEWVDPKSGDRYKLVGPLTKAQLDSVKARLPPLKD